jgi:hypothetical protein
MDKDLKHFKMLKCTYGCATGNTHEFTQSVHEYPQSSI